MKTFAFLFSVSAILAVAVPADAAAPCGARADIIKMLSDKYSERPRAMAIAGQTNLIEIFTSKAGSWTMLVTQPKGATCIIGAGQSWEDIPEEKKLTGL
jgi:hypothetical protein